VRAFHFSLESGTYFGYEKSLVDCGPGTGGWTYDPPFPCAHEGRDGGRRFSTIPANAGAFFGVQTGEVGMEEKKLGERVKAFRELQEISRDELASRTGLTAGFIEELENDDVSPSLGPLLKISRALGVRLGTFMDDELGNDMCVCRLCDLKDDEVVMRKGASKHVGMKFHSLGAGKSDRHMEPFFIEAYPDEKSDEKTLSSHEGEEFIVVVSGKIEVILGREHHLLGPGDSIYFNSIVPHYVGCGDADKAEMHAVLYLPE